jgi:NADH dehydrogenase (ubiquinone) 1 alpha subcomplex subunit 2
MVAISPAIKELRFFLPQSASTLKTFLLSAYPQIKAQHPYLPVLIRECQGVQPTIVARLDKGVEVKKHVGSFTDSELKNFLVNP